MYVWIKATPKHPETSELDRMEGFTWTTWKCSLNCGSHGHLKPSRKFRPWGITEDQPLCFFLPSLREPGRVLGLWRALGCSSRWLSLSLSAHFYVCLALIDGEISKLTEEVRFGCEALLKYELHADGSLLSDCKIIEVIKKKRGRKRLVKSDSMYTLCF